MLILVQTHYHLCGGNDFVFKNELGNFCDCKVRILVQKQYHLCGGNDFALEQALQGQVIPGSITLDGLRIGGSGSSNFFVTHQEFDMILIQTIINHLHSWVSALDTLRA